MFLGKEYVYMFVYVRNIFFSNMYSSRYSGNVDFIKLNTFTYLYENYTRFIELQCTQNYGSLSSTSKFMADDFHGQYVMEKVHRLRISGYTH